MTLKVTAWEEIPGVFIIRPEGELVINNHDLFEREVKAVLNKEPAMLIFDLVDVDYLSSMGLRTLLVAHKKMMKREGRLFLANLQPQVKKILDIVNAFPAEQIFSDSGEMRRFLGKLK
jgi:anti-anti-sigma factor